MSTLFQPRARFSRMNRFADLNLWVDDRTLDGLVKLQECVNL